MKFSSKYVIQKEEDIPIVSNGLWNPTARDYKDIIEDYLDISRRRRRNKLAILKLQIHLLEDLMTHQQLIDQYKNKLEELEKESTTDKKDIDYVKSQMFTHGLLVRNLKDIADGIAWRYFNYDRALLYYLADKPDKGPLRYHAGTLNELTIWSETFDYGQSKAMINDLTNVIRIGDITIFNDNGGVEFVEVKSSNSMRGKKRRGRVERQKSRLEETIKFFNTGIKELDGRPLRIVEIPFKPKNRYDLLEKIIIESQNNGASHGIIEDYLLVECANFEKTKDDFVDYFKKNSDPIRKKWKSDGDFLLPSTFLTDRLKYSKNLAPFSIWPFNSAICANLMMGRIVIGVTANISEIQRKFEKNGWEIEKSIFSLKEEEIKKENISYVMKLKRGAFGVELPPGQLARSIFEFLSPDTLLEEYLWLYKNTPKDKQSVYTLTSYEKEGGVWD